MPLTTHSGVELFFFLAVHTDSLLYMSFFLKYDAIKFLKSKNTIQIGMVCNGFHKSGNGTTKRMVVLDQDGLLESSIIE